VTLNFTPARWATPQYTTLSLPHMNAGVQPPIKMKTAEATN